MCCLFVAALRHLSGRRGQPATRQVEVCQRQLREHLRPVLGDASVAHFAIAEPARHDAKDVLDLGSDRAVSPTAVLQICACPSLPCRRLRPTPRASSSH
jgi:hypothetical protein